jgi:hypothetical protein
MLGRRDGIGRGQVILWIVAAANLGLVLVTKRGVDHYYLLPLYSVLPCWMGEFLDWLRQRRPQLAGVALAGLTIPALWANWHDSLGTTPPAERRRTILERRVDALIPWLEAHDLHRVYLGESTPLVFSYGATYLAGGRVI